MSTDQTPLNPDAMTAAQDALWNSGWGSHQRLMTEDCKIVSEIVLRAYLAADQPVVTGEQVNRAGWTCDGIHEPGSYATCDDCREACNDLANFYNQMRRTPEATGPWTYRPEVPGA